MENTMNELRGLLMRYWPSIVAAAIACNIDVRRLYREISGESTMTIDDATSIADATGVTVADVIAAAQSVRQRAGPNVKKSPRKYCSTSGGEQ